jgi:formate hydrogenlyase subunit 6/NADH:ubiquinone oxidoreductase subunit I
MVSPNSKVILERDRLQTILDAIRAQGFRILGPTVRDEAIIYDDISRVEDLPIGWTDEQGAGRYRLCKRSDQAVFGFIGGAHSSKQFLFLPREMIWKVVREGKGFRFVDTQRDSAPLAFFGVRSCDLHAISIQDKVFMPVDPGYRARREKALIVAVQCGLAGKTCFCASMGTGPRATGDFDLALTEILEKQRHYFVVEIGTQRGAEIMEHVSHQAAAASDLEKAEAATRRALSQMGRTMEASDVKDLLYRNYEHPQWDDVARRCLTCANCTLVCPTCFCSSLEDATDLSGDQSERRRQWDSCFNLEHSYLHGGNIRSSPKARYRQWMTHKLATWQDQFGTSGCVGCGRCITWCPVGIDITAEVRAIRESEKRHGND